MIVLILLYILFSLILWSYINNEYSTHGAYYKYKMRNVYRNMELSMLITVVLLFPATILIILGRLLKWKPFGDWRNK